MSAKQHNRTVLILAKLVLSMVFVGCGSTDHRGGADVSPTMEATNTSPATTESTGNNIHGGSLGTGGGSAGQIGGGTAGAAPTSK
jgi:hypothetical protein